VASSSAARGRILAGIGITAALLFFVGWKLDLPWLRLLAKPLPALVLAGWVLLCNDRALGRLVSIGLVVSALGDLLLEAGRFLPGLVAFLGAHLAYLAAFLSDERRLRLLRLAPFAAWTASIFPILHSGLGDMTVPVAVYVGVITIMMWRAAARVGSPATPRLAARLGIAGAIAFGASDTLIALDRFAQPIPGVQLPILVLYWLGQWGIAASAALGAREAS
jgi:alkenylglycerophosphocholine/alkenylglycerophosphoethanolamine hydrolase